MKSKSSMLGAGLLVGSVVALTALPAEAASFSSFNFTTHKTGSDPSRDILLQSVTVNGSTISDFILVNGVSNLVNMTHTGGNTGAASADRGDRTTTGVNVENPTTGNIVTNLGNLNLNNIVDTEDNGAFSMDLRLSRGANRFFVWERGMNSRLLVQALDKQGNVIAQSRLNSANSAYAGYSINTTEIGGAQRVGSMGLALNGATTNRFRLISQTSFNGPDFKVAGATVPEPATLLGLSIIGGAIATARGRKAIARN